MNGIELLDYIVEFSYPAVAVCFMVFLLRKAPPRRIYGLYTFRVHMLWSLPFNDRWREEVAPEHIETIGRFRKGLLAYELAILVVVILRAIYLRFLFMRLHGF